MSTLESRYRRLLALYPRTHRAIHEEEMLGVLLAASRPDRRWPGIRDFVDLLGGALRIRLRRLRSRRSSWSDALAVVAVLAPILMLLGLSLPAAGLLVRAALNNYGNLTLLLLGVAVLAWPAVLVLALAGLRRMAIASAWILALLGLYVSAGEILEWGQLGILSAAAITMSPGPARGIAVLGRNRLIAYVVGVVLLGAPVAQGWAMAGEIRLPRWTELPVAMTSVAGLLLIMWVAFRINTPTDRRTSILLALPLTAIALSAFQTGVVPIEPQGTETTVSVALPVIAFLGVVLINRLAARRGQGSPDLLNPGS